MYKTFFSEHCFFGYEKLLTLFQHHLLCYIAYIFKVTHFLNYIE
jgi:hypothetical protein